MRYKVQDVVEVGGMRIQIVRTGIQFKNQTHYEFLDMQSLGSGYVKCDFLEEMVDAAGFVVFTPEVTESLRNWTKKAGPVTAERCLHFVKSAAGQDISLEIVERYLARMAKNGLIDIYNVAERAYY